MLQKSLIAPVIIGGKRFHEALRYHKKALEIHEELQDRVRMARDYVNIGLVLSNIKSREAAVESLTTVLEILQVHEEKTGYHHPLSDTIKGRISELQEENDKGGKQ